MAEELQKAGLYIDDIYRLRAQNPRIATDANEIREKCLEFSTKLQEFKKLSEQFHKIFNDFSKDVERERIRAISVQNLLKTIAKRRQTEQQIFQGQIFEKSIEAERLKNEYHHLEMVESEQQELINNFVQNQ